VKYDNMNLNFRFDSIPECAKDDIEKLEEVIEKYL